MPLTHAFVSERVFHYTGSEDYENLWDYLSSYTPYLTRRECVLRSDGSVRYYVGSLQYAVVQPGDWLTSHGQFSADEFARLAHPVNSEDQS